VKIINAVIILFALGCAKSEQPSAQKSAENPTQPAKENEMSQTDQAPDDSSSIPPVPMLVLGMAVPPDEMPPLLQKRIDETPAVIRLEETRALDPETKKQVLAVVERAIEHYRKKSEADRAYRNPAKDTADRLQAFLEAARK
jgi:hypothetical protein